MNLSNVTLNSVTLHNPIYQVSFLEIIGKHFFTIREWVCCATHFALIVTIEAWGKVIFSQVCASQSVHRGERYDVTSRLAAWSHVPSGKGVFVPGPMFLLGVSVQEVLCLEGSLSGGLCPRGLCLGVSLQRSLSSGVSVQWGLFQGVSVQLQTPAPVRWRAGDMHPTGILSCSKFSCINLKCTVSMKNYHYRKRQFPHFTTNFDADKVRANDIWKPILLWIDFKLSSQLVSYNILFHLVESLLVLPKFYLFITVYMTGGNWRNCRM